MSMKHPKHPLLVSCDSRVNLYEMMAIKKAINEVLVELDYDSSSARFIGPCLWRKGEHYSADWYTQLTRTVYQAGGEAELDGVRLIKALSNATTLDDQPVRQVMVTSYSLAMRNGDSFDTVLDTAREDAAVISIAWCRRISNIADRQVAVKQAVRRGLYNLFEVVTAKEDAHGALSRRAQKISTPDFTSVAGAPHTRYVRSAVSVTTAVSRV